MILFLPRSFLITAMLEVTPAVRWDLFLGSGQFYRALASWDSLSSAVPFSDQDKVVRRRWHQFFLDPSQWWDNRSEKVNVNYPDFKHKISKKGLWLDCESNPPWVAEKLAAIGAGTLQMDIFSWNRRLEGCAKAGQYKKIMELFQQVQREGLTPDEFTFIPVLNACASLQDLEMGRCIHRQIMQSGYESNVYVGSCLIDMYAKCGTIGDAWRVFDKMPIRNVVVWCAMILGFVKFGQGRKALELCQQMQEQGVEPNSVAFVAMINACASIGALQKGRHIHEQIMQSCFDSDIFVCNSLIDMYAKCGSIDDAWSVFKKMPTHNVVSWNAMIGGYVKCGQGQKGLELYRNLEQEGLSVNPVTFVAVLNACACALALDDGRRVHDRIIQSGLESDVFVGNCLVNMYAKCGSINDAWKVFNKLPLRDAVSWNTMILGYGRCGQGQKALELFQGMQQEGVTPNTVTFVGLLNACACTSLLEEGKRVHEQLIEIGCESDLFIGNSLIDMYAKCGSIKDAWQVFDHMPTRDLVSWNTIIIGHVKCEQGLKALEIYRLMRQEGFKPDQITLVGVLNACASAMVLEEGKRVHKDASQIGFDSDVFVGSSLVDMYSECGSIDDACNVFDNMPTRDVVAWGAMILAYVKCAQGQKALELYREMQQEGVVPNTATFVGLLSACASIGSLENGRRVHDQIIQHCSQSDAVVSSCLVDMYAKCGSIADAQGVFNEMPLHSVVSWTAMLGGYAIHGHATEALRHFERMCHVGIEMSEVTFISLLSACGHAGLVDEALHYFTSMNSSHSIPARVEHYACMVDLLGRAGRLHEAKDLIKMMSCEPNSAMWMSLLGACRVHGNVEMGEQLAENILELDPENALGDVCVILSNLYAAAGKWDDSESIAG